MDRSLLKSRQSEQNKDISMIKTPFSDDEEEQAPSVQKKTKVDQGIQAGEELPKNDLNLSTYLE